MQHFRIEHLTACEYSRPLSLAQQLVRLQPRSLPWQRCLQFELLAQPQPYCERREYDYFGNAMLSLGFANVGQQLQLLARSEVAVGQRPWAEARDDDSPSWDSVVRQLRHVGSLRELEFCYATALTQSSTELSEFAQLSFPAGRPLLAACQDLLQRLHAELCYQPGQTDHATTAAQAWASRCGVCQDFAHIMIAALRSLGLAARYVSGYVRTEPPPGGTRLLGCDASHAWLAVWCPRWGWVELDPTNRQRANSDYIVLAWGRDFADVSPVRGVLTGGASQQVQVAVTVWPERELPKV